MATKSESQLVEEVNSAWVEYHRKFRSKEKGLGNAFQLYVNALDAYTSFLKTERNKRQEHIGD